MTAAGKITTARIQTGDRILVKHYSRNNEADAATLDYLGKDAALGISTTKTGEGVTIARVLKVEAHMVTGGRRDRRVYEIHTTEGVLGNNAPAQTFILAPEDAAGVKRAHTEALAADRERELAALEAHATEMEAKYAAPAAEDTRGQDYLDAAVTKAAGNLKSAMGALEREAHSELADRNWADIYAAKAAAKAEAPAAPAAEAEPEYLDPTRTRWHGQTKGQRRTVRKAQRAARRKTRR